VTSSWPSQVTFSTLGVGFTVRATDVRFGDVVRELMAAFGAAESADVVFSVVGGGDHYQLFDRDRVKIAAGTGTEVAMRLLRHLNHEVVERVTSLAIHAGAVAGAHAVIAFPGPAGTGKSTLVAACLQRGFDYVTDEVVVVRPDLAVDPYPKPLWLSTKSRKLLDLADDALLLPLEQRLKSPVPVGAIGAKAAGRPLRLAHLVVLERGAGRLALEPIGPGEMAQWVLRRAFNRSARPADWFHLVADMGRHAGAWRLSFDDPREAADLLADRFGVAADLRSLDSEPATPGSAALAPAARISG
jgi:hypothetical protein